VNLDALQKIQTLGESAQYDLSCACGGTGRTRSPQGGWIYPSTLPDGGNVFLFKVLLSNTCVNNCRYCANRASRTFSRTSFGCQELADLFARLWNQGRVGGLFLSSGVLRDADTTMEKMIKVVEMVRFQHHFRGYVHLKILPGTCFSLVERAVQLANRVSVNLEAPNQERLSCLAGEKNFQEDLLLRMKWARSLIRKGYAGRSKSQTTQFVVGAADELDQEILEQTDRLYREMDLARVYFSAFQPVSGTPLEGRKPTDTLREHRLYQADFLLRRYGFHVQELVFDAGGNLPTAADPKMIWALSHPEQFPLEVNQAEEQQLLRVPGIGPRSARKILNLRAGGRFHNLEELRGAGAWVKRAAPFLLVDGRHSPSDQLDLFPGLKPPVRNLKSGRSHLTSGGS
jgi:putative DNA modification/repair radical SAM protein